MLLNSYQVTYVSISNTINFLYDFKKNHNYDIFLNSKYTLNKDNNRSKERSQDVKVKV